MERPDSLETQNDERLKRAKSWLQSLGVNLQSDFQAITGDASSRRYFRLTVDGQSCILMDAPPAVEGVRPFIDIARRLRTAKLHAPEILHADRENGYLLLEDLGDDLYRGLLDEHSVGMHFTGLFEVLRDMALAVNHSGLAGYDATMLQAEMDLFPQWYLGCHRNMPSGAQFNAAWGRFCQCIIASALDQPRCFVHRDYHSCNLLKTPAGDVGIIDFQDAVTGPVSYDFISLIWDRYINWPREHIESWMEEFRQLLGPGIVKDIEPLKWQRYCDLMGLQRNFKVVGIFARLYYRDGKHGYLEMIPHFYRYLTNTLQRYPEFSEILTLLEQQACVP